MSTYYVSNQGLDTNDGLSPETAWQTIPKVNQSIESGDIIKFRCGDTFYGQINLKPGESLDKMTTVTSYGEGEKPVISQYKIINSDAWEKVSDGVYRVDLMDTSKYGGNVYDMNSNAGFLLVSGEVKPYKKPSLDELKNQWDFFSDKEDGKSLYVKCDKNPAEYSDDIRVACCIGCIPFRDYMKVEGLYITGTGAHGINGCTLGAHVKDCEFHNIGGSELIGYPHPNTRYGNGVECWTGCHDVTVENCKFTGVYDVAFTMQGPMKGQSWENIHVIGCEMWNNTQCFEIWATEPEGDEGFINCSFENNTCINSGYCWGYDSRPNKSCACHLLMYNVFSKVCDIKIKNNVFYVARPAAIYKAGGAALVPEDYDVTDNLIVLDNGGDIIFHPEEDQTAYKAYCEKIAKNNRVVKLDKFTDPGNYEFWK